MRFNRVALSIVLMSSIACSRQSGFDLVKSEAGFWLWFAENEGQFYSLVSSNIEERERLFDVLSDQLNALHPDLTFEFGPVLENGTREFVISAGGIKEAFPAVESLCASAPPFERWRITKFRPRRDEQLPSVSTTWKSILQTHIQWKKQTQIPILADLSP